MAALVETLRAQHEVIRGLATELDGSLSRGEPAELSVRVARLRDVLAAHLALEEHELFPALLAGQSAEVRTMADGFARSLLQLGRGIVAFLDRHADGPVDVAALRAGWPEFGRALLMRVDEEERHLYPLWHEPTP